MWTKCVRPGLLVGAAALLSTAACAPKENVGRSYTRAAAEAPPPAVAGPARRNAALFPVAPPPFSDGVFPCSECHGVADKVNRTPHKVDFHDTIVLKHDEKNRWCLDCHDAQHRDSLHLADGRRVPFTESYRLCGQCHGPTLRNWKAGEHGKRTGSWSGAKQYLLCPSCHNPHSPRFKPMVGKKPPMRQEAIK